MRTVDTNIQDHWLDRSYVAAHLIELQNGATYYRYTDYNADLSYGGHTYTHLPFWPSPVVMLDDGTQACDVAFSNVGQEIMSLVLNYDMKSWPVVLSEVWLDPVTFVPYGRIILLQGLTDGVECAEEGENAKASISITSSRFPEMGSGPRQEYTSSCRFRFKDEQCAHGAGLPGSGSTGHTACNRNLPDCIARNNNTRFGGFPYAPTQNTKIRWGPQSAVYLDGRTFDGGK